VILRKHLKLSDVDLKLEDSSSGAVRFAGYASVFGGVDSYGDTIIKGAFESTLRLNGLPRMFYEHDWSVPVGKYLRAKEDDKGLWVEGELTPGHSKAADLGASMRHGTIYGLSIGGYVKQGDYDTTETGRVIRKWSRLVEVSPVVFAADAAAQVDAESIKGGADVIELIGAVETVRDVEGLLRDVAGLSKSAACALISRMRGVLVAPGETPAAIEAKHIDALTERINRLAGRLG
jgi:hypothetical protein